MLTIHTQYPSIAAFAAQLDLLQPMLANPVIPVRRDRTRVVLDIPGAYDRLFAAEIPLLPSKVMNLGYQHRGDSHWLVFKFPELRLLLAALEAPADIQKLFRPDITKPRLQQIVKRLTSKEGVNFDYTLGEVPVDVHLEVHTNPCNPCSTVSDLDKDGAVLVHFKVDMLDVLHKLKQSPGLSACHFVTGHIGETRSNGSTEGFKRLGISLDQHDLHSALGVICNTFLAYGFDTQLPVLWHYSGDGHMILQAVSMKTLTAIEFRMDLCPQLLRTRTLGFESNMHVEQSGRTLMHTRAQFGRAIPGYTIQEFLGIVDGLSPAFKTAFEMIYDAEAAEAKSHITAYNKAKGNSLKSQMAETMLLPPGYLSTTTQSKATCKVFFNHYDHWTIEYNVGAKIQHVLTMLQIANFKLIPGHLY